MVVFEDVLEDLGGFGKAQFITVSLETYEMATISWGMMQVAFSGIIPDWYCVVHDQELYSNHYKSHHNDNASFYKTCSVNGTRCDEYVFDTRPYTMINQWDLVCDMSWVKSFVTSMQMVGVLVGSFFAGYLGDHHGRKKTNIGFVLLFILTNVVTALSSTWIMFTICRFVVGISIGGLAVVTPIYSIEFIPTKWRSVVGVLPSFVVGYSLFALTALFVDHSPHLHLINAAVMVPALIIYKLVPESIRWLATHNRIEEALEACEVVAAYNKTKVPPGTRALLESIAKSTRDSGQGKFNYLDLFKGLHIIKVNLILCYSWFAMSLIFYGISFAISSFSGSFSLNIFLVAISDVPVLGITIYLLNRIGRKKTTILLFALSVLFAIGCILTEVLASDHKASILKGMAIAAKSAALNGWLAILIWGPELYPTVIRALGIGANNVSARVGGMLAPFLIDLETMAVFSFGLVAALSLGILLTSLALQETKGKGLSDVMETGLTEVVEASSPEEDNSEDSDLKSSSLLATELCKGDHIIDKQESDNINV